MWLFEVIKNFEESFFDGINRLEESVFDEINSFEESLFEGSTAGKETDSSTGIHHHIRAISVSSLNGQYQFTDKNRWSPFRELLEESSTPLEASWNASYIKCSSLLRKILTNEDRRLGYWNCFIRNFSHHHINRWFSKVFFKNLLSI